MKSLLSALSITVCTVTAAMTGAAAVGTAHAQSFQPAIVFDMGGKFDKSFNEAAYAGAERFKKESGIEYREFEVTQEAQREQALRTMARRGANVVVGVGFAQASAMEKVSQEFADTKFCIIDSVVERPNVQSITFKEHEGSFLVGMMAALASKTGKVGFVGGMDIPLIRNFATGYQQGVKHANPQAEIFQNMTGTTPAAWRDPTRGGELAKSQMDRGADVIYAAAGGTGIVAFYFENEDVLRQQPEPPASRLGPDLHDQAGRRRGLQLHEIGQGRLLAGGLPRPRPQGGGRRLFAGRRQQVARHRRHEAEGRGRQGPDRRGRTPGPAV